MAAVLAASVITMAGAASAAAEPGRPNAGAAQVAGTRSGAASQAAADGNWTATEAPLPAGAAAVPNAELLSVACGSATDCVAVGWYTDSSGDWQGLLVSGSAGHWSGLTAPLPPDAASNPHVDLESVACPSTSTCVAAGAYMDSSGNYQGLLLTGSGSTWTAVTAPLPAGAAAHQYASFSSVACPSAGTCVVAGSYADSAGDQQGVLLTGAGSAWHPVKAPLPPDAASNPYADLASVACTSASACVVAGDYTYDDPTASTQGLLLTGSGSTWTAVTAPLPADGTAQPDAALDAVACGSASNCAAADWYADPAYNQQGLLESGSGSNWAGIRAPLPADAATDPYAFLSSVACPSAVTCVAAGSYNNGLEGLLVTRSGSTWTAIKAPLPADAFTGQGADLFSVACAAALDCLAVGEYASASGPMQGLLDSGAGSNWSPAEAPLPAGATGVDSYSGGLLSVACPSSTTCVVVGSYDDSAGHQQGLLLTGPGAPSPARRYVALGDSVPYGHGLANPYPKPQIGLPAADVHQGPSGKAYPALLASALHLSLAIRHANCRLTGGDLAISGANAAQEDVRRGNDQCRNWHNSESVQSSELPAARLAKDPATLVTIQAGADDIDFTGCMEWELSKFGPIHGTGTQCVRRGRVIHRIKSELRNVRLALTKEIEYAARRAKQVAVLNYYQPIPRPSAFRKSSIFKGHDVNPVCWGLSHNLRGAYDDSVIIQSGLNVAIDDAVSAAHKAGLRNVRLVDLTDLEDRHAMCTGKPALFSGELMRKSVFYNDLHVLIACSVKFTKSCRRAKARAEADLQRHAWRAAHPNAYGQRDIARAIEAQVRRLVIVS